MLAVFRKDLRLFFRERKNLVLSVATPVFIMLVLGNLALGAQKEQYLDNIRLGYCSKDPSFTLPFELDLVTFPDECEARTYFMVKRGELRGALYVPERFTEDIAAGSGASLILVLDNAKGQVAFTLRTAIESAVSGMNEKIGVAFIEAAWERLSLLNSRLKEVVGVLALSRSAVEDIHLRALSLNDSLSALDFPPGKEALRQANDSLAAARAEAERMAMLRETARNLSAMRVLIANLSEQGLAAGGIPAGELALLKEEYAMRCGNASAECEALNRSVALLEEALARQEEARARLAEQLALLAQAGGTDIVLQEGIDASEGALRNLSEVSLSAAETVLAEAERLQGEVRRYLLELDELVVNTTGEIISLQDELNLTTQLLDEYTARSPRNIVRAVSLEQLETFPDRLQLEFLAPNQMLQVLLFLSLLLGSMAVVEERRSMTMFRTLLSPMPIARFLVEKLLFLTLLGTAQLAIMLAVVWLQGAKYALSGETLLAATLAAVLFSSLGLLLGSLARSENTALLSVLVLAIPMLFLSGLLFPFEAMSPVMASVSRWSPLTMSITNAERLLIYHTGVEPAVAIIQLAVAVGSSLLAAVVLSRSPSPD